jgi:hypothetical protein
MGFCYRSVKAHVAFPFLCFFRQNVTFETLLVSYFSSCRYFEAFFGAGICFYFRHFTLVFEFTLEAFPTGGSLSNLFRNTLPPGHSLWKRGAKIMYHIRVSKVLLMPILCQADGYPLPIRVLPGFQGQLPGFREEPG